MEGIELPPSAKMSLSIILVERARMEGQTDQPSIQCLKIVVIPCPGRPIGLGARACTRSRCRSRSRRPGGSRLGGRAAGWDRSPYYATAPETW